MKKKKTKSGRGQGREVSLATSSHHHHHHGNHRSNKVVIRQYEELPNRFRSNIDPLNLEEQKLRFLQHGQIPRFQFKVSPEKIEELSQTKRAEIQFDLLDKAMAILEKVRQRFGSGNVCVEQMYGERITMERASHKLSRYLQQNGADGCIKIGWTKDQACSAKMAWSGPSMRANRPEARKYSLWLKDSTENQFLRERGILCLADHEIGTHFLRTLNDGHQPWYSSRENFGLKKIRSHQVLETEEGLATINSLVQASNKYLWIPALIYYTACKAATMSFDELFTHLGLFVENRELRWRYVMRVKRSLPDPARVGGYGNDQCYFKGAVEILRNMEDINFHLLYAGKICLESLPRIQRTARLGCIRLPHFLRDMHGYLKTLRAIASVNGISTAMNASSGLSRNVGSRSKKKKARVRRTSSKKKLKRSDNGKSDDNGVAEATSTTDDDDDGGGTEGDAILDDQNGSEVKDAGCNGTYYYNQLTHAACSSLQVSKEQDTGASRNESWMRSPHGARLAPDGRASPLQRNQTTCSIQEASMTSKTSSSGIDARASPHHLLRHNATSEIRCQSQPNFAHQSDDGHDGGKDAEPSARRDNARPQSSLSLPMSRISPTHKGARTAGVSVPSPPASPTSSLQGNGFRWGAAERMDSPLHSTMPLVSVRYNREKSQSPVPFSPHRWLLWRRAKCPPNTLDSSAFH